MSSSQDSFPGYSASREPKHELDSPFLNEELFVDEEAEAAEAWETRLMGLQAPFLEAFGEEYEVTDSLEMEEPESFYEELFPEGETGRERRKNRARVKKTDGVPWRWICKVSLFYKGRYHSGGTGVLISNRHVLTAAHVVYPEYIDPYNYSIKVTPALNYGDTPFGTYAVSGKPKIPKRYNPKAKSHLDYDYALITLKTRVGKKLFSKLGGKALRYWGHPRCGTNSVFARLEPKPLNGKAAYTAGYPKSKGGKQLWCAAGILHTVNKRRRTMWITADTTKGQSGSPVWVICNSRYYLVGVAVGAGSNSNSVVRVTCELIRQVRAWIRKDGDTPSMGLVKEIFAETEDSYADDEAFADYYTDEEEELESEEFLDELSEEEFDEEGEEEALADYYTDEEGELETEKFENFLDEVDEEEFDEELEEETFADFTAEEEGELETEEYDEFLDELNEEEFDKEGEKPFLDFATEIEEELEDEEEEFFDEMDEEEFDEEAEEETFLDFATEIEEELEAEEYERFREELDARRFNREVEIEGQIVISKGQFGESLIGIASPPKVVKLLRLSITFMRMVYRLDKVYVNYAAYSITNNDGIVIKPKIYRGRRLLSVNSSPVGSGSSFEPANSVDNAGTIDLIWIKEPPTSPRLSYIGELVRRIAHETTHAYNLRVLGKPKVKTLSKCNKILAFIDEEVATRKKVARILREIKRKRGGRILRSYKPAVGLTRAEVARDFFPAKLRRTYLEQAVISTLMSEAIRKEKLGGWDIVRLNKKVDSFPLPLGVYSPSKNMKTILASSKYAKYRYNLRVINLYWEIFLSRNKPGSSDFKRRKERVLQNIARQFFEGVISYTLIC